MSAATPLWTDDEMGHLESLGHMTAREAAAELGRSISAVKQKRRRLAMGWTPERTPWSADEDDFLRSVPHYTAAQAGAHLGRTGPAVSIRRGKLGIRGKARGGGPRQGTPFEVGARTLLAKTCPGCGLLLAASWFGRQRSKDRAIRWRPRCLRCQPAKNAEQVRAYNAKRRAEGAARGTLEKRLQALSLDRANKRGEPYTEKDHEVLARPDLTTFEKATTLGRTYFATKNLVSESGYTSRVGRGEAVTGQWIIRLQEAS